MPEFHALSLLGVSVQQLTHSVKQLSALPHIGEQRIRLVVEPTQVTTAAHLVKEGELPAIIVSVAGYRSEEHTSELQSRFDLVCRLLLEKKNKESAVNM